jgi:hypothetical protein
MKGKALVIVMMVLVYTGGLDAHGGKMGPEEIMLSGGTKKDVAFPHEAHQKTLKDCMVCHDLFPQTHGSIQALIKEGKLKKKKVMNSKCVNCHKTMKKAGKKTGPIKCSTCHVK